MLNLISSALAKISPAIATAAALEDIHTDFNVHSSDGAWRLNMKDTPRDLSVKVRVAFNDAALLDNCLFYAKIGMNTDKTIPRYRYVAVAYGRHDERGALAVWAKHFPFAEFIDRLDRNGKRTVHSTAVRI